MRPSDSKLDAFPPVRPVAEQNLHQVLRWSWLCLYKIYKELPSQGSDKAAGDQGDSWTPRGSRSSGSRKTTHHFLAIAQAPS